MTKIIIEVNGKEETLSLSDAERLYRDLDRVFGNKQLILNPHVQPFDRNDPLSPAVGKRYVPPNTYDPWKITMQNTTRNMCINESNSMCISKIN
ncbi:MAG: hypothetical protein KAJ39_03120 [Gammaproteobacteria bacterium]|nr:hypothetical protein [Gammaproteobacteria bacterium]